MVGSAMNVSPASGTTLNVKDAIVMATPTPAIQELAFVLSAVITRLVIIVALVNVGSTVTHTSVLIFLVGPVLVRERREVAYHTPRLVIWIHELKRRFVIVHLAIVVSVAITAVTTTLAIRRALAGNAWAAIAPVMWTSTWRATAMLEMAHACAA